MCLWEGEGDRSAWKVQWVEEVMVDPALLAFILPPQRQVALTACGSCDMVSNSLLSVLFVLEKKETVSMFVVTQHC